MSKEEIAAIKKGKIVMGMSKKAVLVCYGPPPEHATFRQEHNVWDYWTSKFIRMKIFFNDNDKVSGYRVGMYRQFQVFPEIIVIVAKYQKSNKGISVAVYGLKLEIRK